MRWSWQPGTGVLAIAPGHEAFGEPAFPAELRLPERSVLGWATARLVLHDYGMQLFLLPRIEGVTTPAAMSAAPASRLDLTSTDARRQRAFEDAAGPLETGDTALLRTRIADRERIVEWQIVDLADRAGEGRVVPRAILGVDALSGWRVHWLPDQAMFALEPRSP